MEQVLEFLSTQNIRVKLQQIDEEELTQDEKLVELKKLTPAKILARFGTYLSAPQLSCFTEYAASNYDVKFYLEELEKFSSTDAKKKLVRNRRFEALHRLVDNSDYFNEEEMARRDPMLYNQLIGQYHNEAERAIFLKRSAQSTSSSANTPLADMFLAHMSRDEGQVSDRRKSQEDQIQKETEAEYDDEEDDDDNDEMDVGGGNLMANINDENVEELDDDEKEVLKEEFFTTMYRKFLEGNEVDFDYTTIDESNEYDIGEDMEQDIEDKYFDDETPAILMSSDNSNSESSSNHDSSNIVEVEGTHNSDKKTKKNDNNEPNLDAEEEDELDAYMKIIDMEVIGQKVEKL